MTRNARWAAGIATSLLATIVGTVPALAAVEPPSASAILTRACNGRAGQEIHLVQLGEAILREADYSQTEFVADLLDRPEPTLTPRQAYERALLIRLNSTDTLQRSPNEARNRVRLGIHTVERWLLGKTGQKADIAEITGPAPDSATGLFAMAQPDWRIRCKPGDPPATFVGDIDATDERPIVSIRQKPEELALVGDERRTAGAFQLGFERTRTKQEDGSVKRDTDFSIDGTAGVRLTAPAATDHAYAYARYQLQRSRTRPRPQLDPGKRESDGDTDALETGVLFSGEITRNTSTAKLFLDAQVSAVFDFNNDASRLKLRTLFEPALDVSLGLCGLGSYATPIAGLPIRTRCRLQLDVEGAQVLKRGTSPLGRFDSFLAAGGRAELETFLQTSEDTALLGTLSYRLLPVLHGEQSEIERFEAALKYRFWTRTKVGVDVGLSYLKGENEVSFEDEDILTFGLGLIY